MNLRVPVLLFIWCIGISSLSAADRYWVSSGASGWSSSANWSTSSGGAGGASVPGAADRAIFNGGGVGDCQLDIAVSVKGVLIQAGYTGTIRQGAGLPLTIGSSSYSQAAGAFEGSDADVTLKGTYVLSAGTFTSTTGNFQISGAFTHTAGGTFTHNFGTVTFVGNSTTANVATSEEFYTLKAAKNNGQTLTVASGDTLVVLGTFAHDDGNLNGNVEARGNVAVGGLADGGTGTISFLVDGDQTISGGGGKTAGLIVNKPSGVLNAGVSGLSINAFTLSSGNFTATSGVLTDRGAWTHTAGTFDPNGGTVVFTGGSSTINVPVTETFHQVIVQKNNGTTLTVSSGDILVVLDLLTHADGRINGNIEPRGDVEVGAAADGGTGTLAFKVAGDQGIAGNGGQTAGISVAKPSGSVFLGDTDLSVNAVTLASGALVSTSSTLTNRGAWTQTTGTFDSNGGTVAFTGANSTINVPASAAFNDVFVQKNNNATLTVASGKTFVIKGALAHNDGKLAGTVEAQGNVTIGVGADGGTAKLGFAGTADQVYSDLGGNEPDGAVTINKSAGTVALASAWDLNAASQTLTVTAGTLDLAGQNLSVTGALTIGAGGVVRLQGGESIARGSFTAAAGSSVIYDGSGSYSNLALGSAYHHLTFDGTGSWTLAAPVNANGNLTIDQGTVDAAGQPVTVAGNWSNEATFNSGSNTVTLTGTNQTILGETTFFNLTKVSAGTASLTIESDKLQTVTGTLTLKGTSSARLNLRSNAPGSQWVIDPKGERVVLNVDVQDSYNANSEPIDATSTSLDSGNNTNWLFTGTGWSGLGLTSNWSDSANWFGGVVPGSSDTALFNAYGTKSCTIDADVMVKALEIRAGYPGVLTQGSGHSLSAKSVRNDGQLVLGSMSELVLTGSTAPLSGSGLVDTTTHAPNRVAYRGDESIFLAAPPLVPSYQDLELTPPAGLSRYDVLRGNAGEYDFDSAAIDTANGYGYFGAAISSPSRIVKVRLSDFTRVGAITMNSGEDMPGASFIDGGYLYVAMRTTPGKVVKIRLSDFSRVGALTLNTGENNPISVVHDAAAGMAYFGTRTFPGRIVKVRLSDFTRVGALTLGAGQDELITAVGDPSAGYAYFATRTAPSTIHKLRLSDFTHAGALTLNVGENDVHSAVLDAGRGFAYFGTDTAPGKVVRVRLSSFSREDALTLDDGDDGLQSAVLDSADGHAYFGTNSNEGTIVKVNLDSFLKVDGIPLGPNEYQLYLSAAIDPTSGFAYFPTDTWVATVVKVNLRKREANWEHAVPMTVSGDLAIGAGKLFSHSQDLTVGGDWSNKGTYLPGVNMVTLNGGDQAVSGHNAFNNLTKTSASGATLTFESGKTQAVGGKLSMQGAAANRLKVRASSPAQGWKLDAALVQTIRYADVKDTDASFGQLVYALGSLDTGNNQNVIFSAPATIAITTPAASAVSPAWVEGTVSGDVTTIDVGSPATPPGQGVRFAATKWFATNSSASLGITLSPSNPTHVAVTATNDFGDSNSVQQDLTWTATDLTGQSFSSDSVVIRKGDSLLLTAIGAGTVLTLDVDGDGSVDFTGTPGQAFPAPYGTAGTFTAQAKIDGVDVGSLLIVVMSVNLDKPVACEVGFQREKDVVITPAAQASNVTFGGNDPLLLSTSVKGPFNTVDGQGTTIYLSALRRGTPVLTARVNGAAGPMVGFKEVDEFTRDIPALWSAVVNDDTSVGGTKLTLRPYVPNLRFQFNMFASTSTFGGGATNISVNTSDIDPSTGQTFFKQVLDPETGEIVGEYDLSLEVPPEEIKYCFWVQAFQSSSQEKIICGKEAVNGGPCRVSLENLCLGVGTRKDLNVQVKKPKGVTGHPNHKIVIEDLTIAEWTALGPAVNCNTGKVEFSTSVNGLKAGRASVKIEQATWENVITVVEVKSLEVSGAEKVRGRDTFVTGKQAGDVEITAILNPPVTVEELPANFITWSGGDTSSDQLHRKVTKTKSDLTDVKAKIDYANGPKVEIAVVEIDRLDVRSASRILDTDDYVAAIEHAGDVTIVAKLKPYFTATADDLPSDLVTWTEGAAGIDMLHQTVTKTIAGITTVTAYCGDSSETATIKVVEVASLTVSGAAQVGTTTTFVIPQTVPGDVVLSATLNPALTSSELPSGIPSWTGGSLGSDKLHRNVDKLRAAVSDVTVTCGSSSRTVQIIVWNIRHATVAAAPDGTAATRSTVGVCEDVTFTSQAPVTWTVASRGAFTPPAGARVTTTFNAPDVASNCVITATDAGGRTVQSTLKVIPPNDSRARKISNREVYPVGSAGAGMDIQFRLHPLSVSFGNIETLEVPGPASNITGYFVGVAGPHAPSPFWTRVADDNWEAVNDTAGSAIRPQPWSDGSYDWVVPNNYRRQGSAIAGHHFVDVTQHFTMAADGTAGVTKGGVSCSRHPDTGYAP